MSKVGGLLQRQLLMGLFFENRSQFLSQMKAILDFVVNASEEVGR